MGITVKELINAPFSNRSPDDKIKIVSEGKPQPVLHMSTVTMNENGEMKTEIFDPVMYYEVSWLTGCETTRSFYCWPCLLFSTENEHWNVDDLAFLSDAMAEHDKIVEHILSVIRLKKFSSKRLKMENINLEHDQCNQIPCTRTKIIMLIDAVCSIVAEGKSLSRKKTRQNQIEPDTCLKALNLLKLCNSSSFNFEDAIELIKMSPTVLDDLVDAMSKVLELAIRNEVRMSTYAAIIISDHSTNREKSQMSVVLRYIKKGKVWERFLGFINIFGFKSVDVLQEIIANTIATFGVTTKFLAYSIDGAVLELPALFNLNNLLQKKYPKSFFVPCYFQGLVHIIQQSLSMHVELTQFFKILDVMEAYFQEASEQRKLFEHFMFLNISRENAKWYVKAPFIKIVCRCRNYFMKALESIIKNSTKWSSDDNTKAHGLIRFLKEFHTVCLLHILSPLYEHIMGLDEVLRTNSPELEFKTDLVNAILSDLRSEKDHFEEYFNMAIQEMDKANNVEQENTLHIGDLKDPFQLLFITVIGHLEKEIVLRFGRLEDLSFCSLVNVNSFKIPRVQLDYWYWKLNNTPGHNFSSRLFDSEIIVQRTNGIDGKSAYELLNLFENLNLKNVFKCTNRLLEFTLTMPFRTPVLHGVSSKLQKIKRLSYPTTVCIETRGDATALYVESDFLRDLRSNEFFCDEVMQKLYEINKSKQV